ncbi:hypothetical protein [Actinoplanes teichomyceticus]|uniref:Uncharacterized protein n=1 Tax=Actinoplanes teichomyceticus TaxID=1867 RepID=A0A561WAJ4_ACTTI|nr:hypothetical protein [Actinoplanes teichomyceticus]TWG20873.1 hypothetical protein FHX34_103402 [Actinoplanes teichomyceticus]GIF14534.1 hypothetical protein Ate01nite_45660 [Actinoplanes teichomyceticus]
MDSPVVPGTDDPSGPPPAWPRIADYWPDAPHRLGPPADHYELPGVDATRTGPALHTRRPVGETAPVAAGPGDRTGRDLKPVLVLLVVVLLVGAGVAAAVSWPRTGRDPATSLPAPPLPAPSPPPATPPVSIGTSPPSRPATSRPQPPASPTAPGGAGRTTPAVPAAATLELADGVTQLRVRVGDVRGGLVRVETGADSAITARASVDGGTVRVAIGPSGRTSGSARLDVLLSDEVRWSFRMRGGVHTAGIDLSGGRVGAIELIGGSGTMDLVLPGQRDAIPITERGGLGTWRIVTGGEVPVRALFREGAGSVTLYGRTDDGVARGGTARAGRGDGGIRLDSTGGVGALTVQAR